MFRPLKSEDFKQINALLAAGLTEDTTWTATTMIGWLKELSPSVVVTERYILLQYSLGDITVFPSPLVGKKEDYSAAVDALEAMGVNRIQQVTPWQAQLLKERGYEIQKSEGEEEYIYDTEALVSLKGKKYHAKRNFINSADYPYLLRPYRTDDYDGIVELMYRWKSHAEGAEDIRDYDYEWKTIRATLQKSDFEMELTALTRVLSDLEGFNCIAAILESEGKIIGFAVGERMASGGGVMYFEKADTAYKGVYAVLDHLFLKEYFSDVRFINKQEDLGIEGLRKSKLSYHPVRFAERYLATKPKGR